MTRLKIISLVVRSLFDVSQTISKFDCKIFFDLKINGKYLEF